VTAATYNKIVARCNKITFGLNKIINSCNKINLRV
jgi:hypothetical protein